MTSAVETLSFDELISSLDPSIDVVIDADGAVLGRLASYVAKLLRLGFRVYVVNVEKSVVTGSRSRVVEGYKLWLEVKTLRNPYRHSPKRPRNPILLFKKTVKNMLPKENGSSLKLLRNLKAYIDVPPALEKAKRYKIVDTLADKLMRKEFITVAELCKELGWRGL